MSTLNISAPITRRVRAYLAPVDRNTNAPTVFDPAQSGHFTLDSPPAPWTDLGWCRNFRRVSDAAKTDVVALRTGVPAMPSAQARTAADAIVELEFTTWGKLQLALSCGSQQMNLLATQASAASNGSGGTAADAVALQPGSTATSLNAGGAASQFNVGDLIVVDDDYTGQTGFVGGGISGAYVQSANEVSSDISYIRRVSLNVGRIAGIVDGALLLEAPLLAGVPSATMKVSRVAGFVDREGGTFFQQWSGLFVMEGEQGDRVIFYYPRLESMRTAAETSETLAATLEHLRLAGAFRALPVRDPADGEMVLCFRSYLPA